MTPTVKYQPHSPSFCAYADAGFTLFPMYRASKIPYEGFLDRHFDLEFTPVEGLNYGVLLRRQFLIIDCDPRNYAENDKPLFRLLSDLELPTDFYKESFIVKTPRGGVHIYLSKPPDMRVVTSLKEYPGLEFKDQHIIAAGSYIDRDPKGEVIQGHYRVVSGSPSKIIKCPIGLLNKLKRQERPQVLNVKITPDQEIDIKKFKKFCQSTQPAVEGQNGDLVCFKTACKGRELGLSQDMVYTIMDAEYMPRCSNPDEKAWLASKVASAFGPGRAIGTESIQNEFPDPVETTTKQVKIRYQFDGNNNLKRTVSNLKMFFKYPTIDPDSKNTLDIPPIGNYLGFNQFSNQICWIKQAPWFKDSNEWDGDDAIHYKVLLSEQLGIDFDVKQIHEVALVCSKQEAFHPVRDYIDSLKWDGQPRLNNWLSRYCGAIHTDYTSFVGRKTLVAAVSRVFRPGCKFDHVLVFEGDQGLGKSYLWEQLSAPFFTDAPLNIQDKGAVEVMQGKWIIELGEMEAHSKFESKTIKGFLSRVEDRCRMAYAHTAKNFPRQCIFVGTINPEQAGWLKDPTGDRRYWPVPVYQIDIAGIKRDRDQLWAEAYEAFQSGEQIHVEDAKMRALMAEIVAARLQEDPWFNMVERHLTANLKDYIVGDKYVVEPTELYCRVCSSTANQCGTREYGRIAMILKTLGYQKERRTGRHGYTYAKPIPPTEEEL